ncbi:helix-turn-helix domain-containing protein [Streptomyces sp. NPDC058686]|uniref:PucR family transcriptional regulator n=1 Tax=Streptomyces sp. NPDC058686 TaxID=3346599 RepID=UPI00365709A8
MSAPSSNRCRPWPGYCGHRWSPSDPRNTDPRQPAVLRRIEELGKQSGTDYFRTLQVYVDNNRNIAATAAVLGVHPNTARYRVEEIQATFNLDLADLDTFTWLVLHCRYLSRSTAGARPAN